MSHTPPPGVPITKDSNPPRVCDKCGWYVSEFGEHAKKCHAIDVKNGALADKAAHVMRKQLQVESTKLGYGHGYLTFEIDDNTHVRVTPRARTNTFCFDELYMLDNLTLEELIVLVAAIKGLRTGK